MSSDRRSPAIMNPMADGAGLAGLIATLAEETDSKKSLDALARASLELTKSRHALIAVMNDELGCLELSHGAGDDFKSIAKNARLAIATGSEEGIVAYVAASGKTFQSGNVRADPRYKNVFESTISEIAVPVHDRYGRIRAVINVESDRRDAYDEATLETCNAIAHLAALVLDQREHRTREEALIEIGRALDMALTEEALIDRVIHIAGTVLRFQACSIFLYDAGADAFVLRGSTSHLRKRVGELMYRAGEGCTGWVCDTGEPILLQNPQNDPRWRGRFVEIPNAQIASFLAVPIVVAGQSAGAIRVIRRVADNPYLDNRFTESDRRLLSAIAEQVAMGLKTIRSMERVIRSERMIAWGELSAKSSHMIGNRVFALKGDINELKHVLEATVPDLHEIQALQASLSTNVLRIEEILQDFRDFLTATQLKLEPGDLNQLIEETVGEIFPRRSLVHLDLDLDRTLPPVSMDSKRLRRAISELIENSLNFVEKGNLRISTRLEPTTPVDRPRVRVEVEDSGPGIDPDRKSIIFQPFHSGRVKGMGLGLSIVKGIVDAHGGEVFEAGEPGLGAKFVIRLPALDRP